MEQDIVLDSWWNFGHACDRLTYSSPSVSWDPSHASSCPICDYSTTIGHSYCLFVIVFSYTVDASEVVVALAAVAAAAACDADKELRRSSYG